MGKTPRESMSILRVLGERLLLFLLLIARIALMATGLAAVAGIFAFGSFIKAQGTSSVVQTAWGWMQATGGLFLAAGVLLFVFRDWIHIPRSGTSGAPPPAWLPAVAVCLVAQIGATLLFSGNLVQLWQDAIPGSSTSEVFWLVGACRWQEAQSSERCGWWLNTEFGSQRVVSAAGFTVGTPEASACAKSS